MMDERFQTFVFFNPLPLQCRVKQWPKCAGCAAKFYLMGRVDVATAPSYDHVSIQLPSQSLHTQPQLTAGSANGCVADGRPLCVCLAELSTLRAQGVLDDCEFRAAKRLLLGLSAA